MNKLSTISLYAILQLLTKTETEYMNIKFCGAAGEVTGSCHLLKTQDLNILVDCGMFQGGEYNEEKNFDAFPFNPADIDIMLLTHAHLDHVGRIPKLVKEGFSGTILTTRGTIPLTRIVLEDAARIMKWNNEKYDNPILFTENDVSTAMGQFQGIEYNEEVNLGSGAVAIWHDAGHILGSAFIEVRVDGKTIVFSGDIGNEDAPILKDTAPLPSCDILVTESTYGDRIHEQRDESDTKLYGLIKSAAERGGAIMMPAFSIERSQELLYRLHEFEEGDPDFPHMPFYMDSPMAIRVLDVFKEFPSYYDQEATAHYKKGEDFLDFPGLELTYETNDSKAINEVQNPKLIIAGAGMMNGGRILHHALRYLPDPNSTLIIIGYQAHGSLGRRLYDGAKSVKIFGSEVEVNATVRAIGGLSAHGDQHKLMQWIGSAPEKPKQVFCVHGEENAATTLAHLIRDTYGAECFVPQLAEEVSLDQ